MHNNKLKNRTVMSVNHERTQNEPIFAITHTPPILYCNHGRPRASQKHTNVWDPLKMSNQSQISRMLMYDSLFETSNQARLYDSGSEKGRKPSRNQEKSGRTQNEPKVLLTTQLSLTTYLAFLAF